MGQPMLRGLNGQARETGLQQPCPALLLQGGGGYTPHQMVDDVLSLQKCSQKSLQVNTTINTFCELEKLTLSEKKKSHIIHMGNQNQNCPALKVHGNLMKHSGQETYLGDIINQNNKIKVNIESRKAKGYGKVAIINEVPLGHWRVDAGLQLQQAMLII